MSGPRVKLLEPDAWPEHMRALADGPMGPLNVMKSLMHHPDLFRRWSVFANHFLFQGVLPVRAREVVILRVAWLTGCEYEWAQHVRISAEACGFGPAEIRDIQLGATSGRWAPGEAALIRLTDGLLAGPRVSDPVWDRLTDNWDIPQMLEAFALVGNYVMLAMALNSLAVPVDPGYSGFDDTVLPRPALEPGDVVMSVPRPPPRVLPLVLRDAAPTVQDSLRKARGDLPSVNVLDTLARHPDLLRRWLPFFSHCLHKQELDLRQRELVILRTAWLAGSAYEWSQHVPIALRRGVLPGEIDAVTEGPEHPDWNNAERALLESVDALMARFTLSDAEWRRLASSVTTSKAIDLIFTVGQYRLVAGLLIGANIQLDPYLRFPPTLA